MSAAFDDDANPAWLLEKNGEMTSVRFETANDSVGLVAALPIPALTAQRLLEMVDDVLVMYAVLLAEYEDEDEDADEDADEDDETWEQSAIIGPWTDRTACLRALDDCAGIVQRKLGENAASELHCVALRETGRHCAHGKRLRRKGRDLQPQRAQRLFARFGSGDLLRRCRNGRA